MVCDFILSPPSSLLPSRAYSPHTPPYTHLLFTALKVQGIPFDDEHVPWSDWQNGRKERTPYGQLPTLTVTDGEDEQVYTQSGAILRFVARMGRRKGLPVDLYPTDSSQMLKIETVLGLAADFDKALAPSLYLAMSPQKYGYAEGYSSTLEGKETVRKLRETFAKETLPRFMQYYSDMLSGHPFFVGDSMTIADLGVLPQLRKYVPHLTITLPSPPTTLLHAYILSPTRFERGVIEHMRANVLDDYPVVKAWYERMMQVPAIADHYATVIPHAHLSQRIGHHGAEEKADSK